MAGKGFQTQTNPNLVSHQPADPQNIPIRPLNKGMILNSSSITIPAGACKRAENFIITEHGPYRRGGSAEVGGGVQLPWRMTDAITFWDTSGDQSSLLLTHGPPYRSAFGAPLDPTDWGFESTADDASDDTLTDTSIDFTEKGIQTNTDVLKIGDELRRIIDVGVTTLTLEQPLDDQYTGESYRVLFGFQNTADHKSGHVVINNELVVTDFQRPLQVYDPVELRFKDYVRPEVGETPQATETLVNRIMTELQNGVTLVDNAVDFHALGVEEDDTVQIGSHIKKVSTVAENELTLDSAIEFFEDESSVADLPYEVYRTQAIPFKASCVEVFLDRLWVGHTENNLEGAHRQRIRWSRATNPRDFSDPFSWIDLPYASGAIQRMMRLDSGLVVYMTDAVFIGNRTNNPDLPVAFQQINTNGIGLVGQKALTSWLNGHFFVGQDDVYFLSNDGLERIGAPVLRETLQRCEHPEWIYVVADPLTECILIGFPEGSERIQRVWRFHYKSGAWSYDAITTDFIANPVLNFQLTWSDLTGNWETLEETYPSWEDMDVEERDRVSYFGKNGYLMRYLPEFPTDRGEPIRAVFESKDYDLDLPDTQKTWLRLGVKIDYILVPAQDIVFTVQVSANRGRRWVSAGYLRIRQGEDEGYASFLVTSSTLRFRLVSDALVTPYYISEIVLRAVGRGREITPGMQSNVPDTQG